MNYPSFDKSSSNLSEISDSNSPLISIITPVFNGENFIEFCIQNVIDQACPHVEHIIVDGGSTDRTVEIIKKYAEKYSHIRWVSEKDQGQSDAMNKGVAKARGKIIGVLNDDDYYEPNVLNQVLEVFQTLPEPSFVVGNCKIWSDEGQMIKLNKPKYLSFWSLVSRIHHFPVNPSAYFYHRSLHERIGLYEVEDHYSMDLDFILKAVQNVEVKRYVNQTWGNYRKIEGTKTALSSNQRVAEKLFKKHRQNLTPVQRFFANMGEFVIYRTKYFVEYPEDIRPAVRRKFIQAGKLFERLPLQKKS